MSWTQEELERGYVIASSDYGNGALHIERIDEINKFNSDEEAAIQAEKDGIKIIRDTNLLLNKEDMAFYIDTPENRELLNKISLTQKSPNIFDYCPYGKSFNCESCVYEVYNKEKEFYECSLRNIDSNTYINKLNRKEEKDMCNENTNFDGLRIINENVSPDFEEREQERINQHQTSDKNEEE